MSLDTLLTIVLDVAFFAVLGFTLIDYLRHRERVRLVVVLCFASVALVLAATPIRTIVPALGPVLTLVALPALLAHPALVLWLASFVRPIPRAALVGAFATCTALAVATLAIVVAGAPGGQAAGSAPRTPALTALIIALLAYFLVLEGAGAVAFALAAKARAGASRSRLVTASIATALFGAALVVVLTASVVLTPGSPASAGTNALVRVVALLSALGYLAAFAPPPALRRLSQQSIAYDFIRELNALPSGTPVERIWELLERTAARASGATRSQIVVDPHGPPPSPSKGSRVVTMPFHSTRWPAGRLELDLGAHALFRDDDLELIELLLERTVRAAERESFIVERERLIADLQAASAAKSDFLAAMSHELRTPLNAIIGFSELLTEGGDEAADAATVQTYAEHIHGSGLHLLELVNDVLDLARVEAGRLDLKHVRFDLDDLVRQTVATLQPLADQKRLAVVTSLDRTAIDADPGRVRQIALNLLSNAIKFTEPGDEIRISLAADGPDHVRLSVADTGIGIGSLDIDRIFEAFHQGDGYGQRTHHEGTGLGLALTRQLVEAHGGSISVRSEVGVGSEFTVLLPVNRPTETDTAQRPDVVAGRPTVLVIEDDPSAQELLRVHLESAGYGVLVTANGRQGLEWLSQIRPDAVILDILLPEMDGWEVLQRLKGDPQTRSIPVMVVSVVDDRQLGLALGAVDYLVKPVSRELLLESLGRLTFTTKVRTRTVTALVIDPDPEALARYRQLLEPDGFRVIAETEGTAGRQRAIDERPDLIVLDAMLADVDGFELAATFRHDPQTSAIPIWVTTPGSLAPDAKARLNGNVQGVLERGDDAITALRSWLTNGLRKPDPGAPQTAALSTSEAAQ
jgi:signal transduction histidine kinase/DNA-binding response OmpR family regulator